MQLLKRKWKNTSQWGSTDLTNALTYWVGKNHRVEKHTINGTECTFKDSRISTSTNRETPIIWLSSIKILSLYMHENLQVPTSKYVIIPSDRCHHRKIRHECTIAQWHCQVVYTPYWLKHSYLWRGHKQIGHFVGRLELIRKPRQEGAQEAITSVDGNCQTQSKHFTRGALALAVVRRMSGRGFNVL